MIVSQTVYRTSPNTVSSLRFVLLLVACLWVSLPSGLYLITEKLLLSRDQVTDLAIEEYLIALENFCVAFAVYFGSLSICNVKHHLISFAAFG